MPELTIDGKPVQVPPGATVLDAARELGVDVPALCFLEGYPPSTSCLVCMVKLRGSQRMVPACGTRAEDGMEVESETPEVHQVRRTALELLLSDHAGDCLAPCHFACPAHMDIPLMLRQIGRLDLQRAIVTIKRDIALPAVLGRVCPKPCEKGCRRGAADGPVAVCELKRVAADADLASPNPYLPECSPQTGKRVAVVGAGPTGLAAAYYLRQKGHQVTLLDKQPEPGGRLRCQFSEEELQRDVLDHEIQQILRLGIQTRWETEVGQDPSLDDLQTGFDAVLVACGKIDPQRVRQWGLEASPRGIQVDRGTFQTSRPGLFAAGCAVRGQCLVVRSVADGKEAAGAIDRYLAGRPIHGPGRPFSSRLGRLEQEELVQLVQIASPAPRQPLPSSADLPVARAAEQAARCLHCDCRKLTQCKLKRYAERYGADPNRYRGPRARFQLVDHHGEVIYEPGKCIDCGLCIEIAKRAGEPLGLTFIGRGFDVRVGVPFNRSLQEALSRTAAQCVAACPTGALALREPPEA
ncbi:MAG TPA: FAD-dependent oxidoreductase [Planctomycetes bacterium]|nr:FAD-dependent oxidoreductase [Planctomycetota bacterium]